MDTTAPHSGFGGWYALAAYAAMVATAISGASLILLHMLSPEFSPSWRMVSEYANGNVSWLLMLVFISWAISSFSLIIALLPLWASPSGKAGLILLALAGVGQMVGGLFDINHKLHGAAALIGIPSLCLAAVIVTLALSHRVGVAAPPLWSAHLPWMSFVSMLAAFALFVSALKTAGVDMSGQAAPLTNLPAGVSGYVGWANRLIFVSSYVWTVFAALAVINAERRNP